MFERFTREARLTVVRAQEEARRLQHRHIGTEHLLLALLLGDETAPARATLTESGITHESAEAELHRIVGSADLDASALSALGIDLDEVRRRTEAQFGPGALDEAPPTRKGRWLRRNATFESGSMPFTDEARESLELALREAIALQQREIGDGHILLGLLRTTSGLGIRVLEAQGLQPGLARTRVAQRLRNSA
jgi:ATP-dependent Clp protease ATP-binding subunit ClpA